MKRLILISALLALGMIMILNIPIASASLSDGLVAYYPFNGNADDESGNGNDGEEHGDITYKLGIIGESVTFDGVDDYINVKSHTPINPIDQLAISFWVKVEGFTNVWSPIIHKGGPILTGCSNREYAVFLQNTTSFLLCSAGDDSSQHCYEAYGAKLGGWTHYVGIIDRKNHLMKIYVDGILKAEEIDSFSTFNNNDNDLIFGSSEEVHSAISPFKGRIDDLRIYNRILSEDEIKSLYNEVSHAITASASLVAHWRFDETGGTTAFDSVGGVNGTLVGGATFITTGGVAGGAIQFTNGYVNMGNNFASTPTFSVQAWIKTDPSDTSSMTPVAKHWAGIGQGYCLSVNNVYDGYTQNDLAGFRSIGVGHPSPTAVGGPAVNDGLWHQLVGVHNNGATSLYVDGNLVGSGGGGYSNNSADFMVGGLFNHYGTPGNAFHGLIDEVKIYNNALTENDVKALYSSTLNPVPISPNHEFSLEEYTQKTYSIQLINPGSDYRSCALEVINPHSALTVSLTHQNPITIAPGEVQDIPIVLDAGSMPVGVYDDLLLKLTVEDGETLYSNIKVTIVEQGTGDLPDLSIRSDDIQLTDYTLGESATLKAVMHNKGLSPASNVQVQFYEFGNFLGETVIEEVPANGIGTTSITAPITTSGEHLIRVVIDPSGAIEELDKTNNEASQIIKIGSPAPIPGNILVTGSLPSTVYTDHLFAISGRAVYDLYVNGTRYTNYVVKGGSVQIMIKDDSGNEWHYGGVHTNINGYFSKTLQAPASPGSYHILMTVTDKTFSGKRNLLFSVTNPPTTTPLPPLPPLPPASFSYGNWTHSPITGTWTWTWTTHPTNAPVPEADLRVFSENIHFSETNPAPDEEITVFAEILYWASSTDLVAQDVPVNFHVTYPGSPRMKIGETVIDRISVGAPDFGSRYVYTTWKNRHEGVYIVEVEIDPNYVEENQLNNAATRAIIIGQIQSFSGVISGQVTDPWGGVGDVIIELYDSSGTTFLENKLTDDTGYYLFENVPVDNYQVHIVKPEGHKVDAETKPAVVSDQSVTEVDFHLTKQVLPIADAGGPYTGSVETPVFLDASGSHDLDGQIVTYEWDFDNDGTYDLTTSSPTMGHAWNADFNGTIGLKVTDNDGLSATDTASVEIAASGQEFCGDLDADGDVDGDDRNILRSALNSSTGDTGFIPEADYDGDGLISYNDYREWYACYKAFIAP